MLNTDSHKHVWGLSRAADYVRAEVSGVAAWENYNFMVIQACIDDSADEKREKVFVLAGYLASAPAWTMFAKEWAEHLDLCRMESFKLSSMPRSRPEITGSFYRILENNDIPLSFDCALDIPLWNKIVDEIDWPPDSENMEALLRNPWFITSKKLMQALFTQADNIFKHENLDLPGPIDLIFDQQEKEEKILWNGWDYFKNTLPDLAKDRVGSPPAFKDDKLFNPLQAADLIAGSVRAAELRGVKPPDSAIFTDWKPAKDTKMKRFAIRMTEEMMRSDLAWILSPENYALAKVSFI